MNLRVIIHEAEEGGYWAEVPALPGCISEGDTLDELKVNIREAIEGCLQVANERGQPVLPGENDKSVQILDMAL